MDTTQPSRELDALVHQRVYGVSTEMRLCSKDPGSGAWEETQAHYERQGEELPKVGWYHAVHPCWLEVTPLPDDWTDEDRQQCPDADKTWHVVPHYSTRIQDTWPLVAVLGMTSVDLSDPVEEFTEYTFTVRGGDTIECVAMTVQHAICLAALRLTGQPAAA